jgi:NAD(P)-dependent dehydrogenase (short-subunit alcohol dehydrogenase family)
MDLELSGRTAVVTGAGRGIGLAVTKALLAEGARVVGVSRTSNGDTDALGSNPGYLFVAADLSSIDGVASLGDAITGPVDVLVNNVGSAPPRPGGFGTITEEDWQQTLALNLLAAVRVTRLLLDRIPSGGAIVNVVSENAILADPLVLDYSAAKAGLLSVTKSLSKQLGPRGVRVNSISPGPVATDLWLGKGGVAQTVSAANGSSADDVRKGAEQQMVTGRFTRPEEVADLVAMLASPRLGNVTGSDFVIDGGMRETM